MQRRQFLQLCITTATTMGLYGCGVSTKGELSSNHQLNRRFGLQLFMVRDAMKKDPERTLSRIAKMGFNEVELFGFGKSLFNADPFFGLTPIAFKKALDDNGLIAPIAHLAGTVEDASKLADVAGLTGIESFVVAMPPEFVERSADSVKIVGVKSLDQLDRMAARLNEEALALKAHALSFGYHNHNMEFALVDGIMAYDYLMAKTEPSLVKIELDVGWVAASGQDPISIIQRYGKRIISSHIKDVQPNLPLSYDKHSYPIPEMAQLVYPGKGILNFEGILSALDGAKVKHRFIEVDVSSSPFEDAQDGLNFLRKIR